jgi:hypothetical protein
MNHITSLDPIPGIQTCRALYLLELEYQRGRSRNVDDSAIAVRTIARKWRADATKPLKSTVNAAKV